MRDCWRRHAESRSTECACRVAHIDALHRDCARQCILRRAFPDQSNDLHLRCMAESNLWAFPSNLQPKAERVRFDLASALKSVVMIRSEVPEDAFTAPILGAERFGNGVVIGNDGLVLTIGYLITEAESVWLTTNSGEVVPAHPLAFDFATGFGLVVPMGHLDAPALPRGSAAAIVPGDAVIVIGHGGRTHALDAEVFAKREFAGSWEYLLDEALFTTPAHPEWSGAALVGMDGRLLGIGSLFVQEALDDKVVRGNMFVPIDLLEPILQDLVTRGRAASKVRPWLGFYPGEDDEDRLVIGGLAPEGPAARAGVRSGDEVLEVAGKRVARLPELYRAIWRMGPPGTEVPLTILRDGARVHMLVRSADRSDFLKKPMLQ
jgi:S1-C subfamily serine protease